MRLSNSLPSLRQVLQSIAIIVKITIEPPSLPSEFTLLQLLHLVVLPFQLRLLLQVLLLFYDTSLLHEVNCTVDILIVQTLFVSLSSTSPKDLCAKGDSRIGGFCHSSSSSLPNRFTMARPSNKSDCADRMAAQASLGHRKATSPPVAQPSQSPADYVIQLAPTLLELLVEMRAEPIPTLAAPTVELIPVIPIQGSGLPMRILFSLLDSEPAWPRAPFLPHFNIEASVR